jgi:hypothetical protein
VEDQAAWWATDIETFPTLLVAGPRGARFLGLTLAPLSRLLESLMALPSAGGAVRTDRSGIVAACACTP